MQKTFALLNESCGGARKNETNRLCAQWVILINTYTDNFFLISTGKIVGHCWANYTRVGILMLLIISPFLRYEASIFARVHLFAGIELSLPIHGYSVI